MGNEVSRRMGRLMVVALPVLQAVARSPWAYRLVVFFLASLDNDSYYRRDWYLGLVGVGRIVFSVDNMTVALAMRPLANGKGSMFTLKIELYREKGIGGLGIA